MTDEKHSDLAVESSSPRSTHPSRNLAARKTGFGIGGGYERPYRRKESGKLDDTEGLYGPVPHAGYYGSGKAGQRFSLGKAGYRDELELFGAQFGETTSGNRGR